MYLDFFCKNGQAFLNKLVPGGASTARSLYNSGFLVVVAVAVVAVAVVAVAFGFVGLVAFGRGALRIDGGSSSES